MHDDDGDDAVEDHRTDLVKSIFFPYYKVPLPLF